MDFAFAQAYTSDAGSEVGKSVIWLFVCVCADGVYAEGFPVTLPQATAFALPALVAYLTLFAESAVLSTFPRPTSLFE